MILSCYHVSFPGWKKQVEMCLINYNQLTFQIWTSSRVIPTLWMTTSSLVHFAIQAWVEKGLDICPYSGHPLEKLPILSYLMSLTAHICHCILNLFHTHIIKFSTSSQVYWHKLGKKVHLKQCPFEVFRWITGEIPLICKELFCNLCKRFQVCRRPRCLCVENHSFYLTLESSV